MKANNVERLWDYDAVEQGQTGTDTLVTLTAENIEEYAAASQNDNSLYRKAGEDASSDNLLIAMPTMVVTYAPLLRENIAEASGFVALERSATARRQTPFAKCEIRWFAPVSEEDVITGSRRVLEKYERRGSRFVTFRVEASNQDGLKVGEYDYTCIFDYAKGQRSAQGQSDTDAVTDKYCNNGDTQYKKYTDLMVGDSLRPLVITERTDVILRKDALRLVGVSTGSNIHTDEEFARQNIFGGAVNAGPSTMSYVDQMLQGTFPLESFYSGGKLLMRAITPFKAGDVVNFTGELINVRNDDHRRFLDCRVKGVNQAGELVCLADATLVTGC